MPVVGDLSTTYHSSFECLRAPLLKALPESAKASSPFAYFEDSLDHLSSFSAGQIANALEASFLLPVIITIIGLIVHFLFDL